MTTIYTKSPDETFEIAQNFAKGLAVGDILLLTGDLGAGKTCFVQGLAFGLGVPEHVYVRSPTFTLVNEYLGGRLPLYHFDFYRLDNSSELGDIGLDEYASSGGVIAIEWAEKFPDALPARKLIKIKIEIVDECVRKLSVI
jgi:tRNA threonylcarbamoyladenosine biosynthesis protein TsaE